MIPVPMPEEPSCFDAKVRQEGLRFLTRKGQDPNMPPQSSSSLWGKGDGDYWREAREKLRQGYNNRCVYSCFILEPEILPNGRERLSHSIDHFQPKSKSPAYLAYEWGNLRWAWRIIDNGYKKDHRICEKHDPTQLTSKIMELEEEEYEKWIVVPAASLTISEQKKVAETIKLLDLNKGDVKIRRNQWVEDFLDNHQEYDADYMKERQPFIYCELKRLGRFEEMESSLQNRS